MSLGVVATLATTACAPLVSGFMVRATHAWPDVALALRQSDIGMLGAGLITPTLEAAGVYWLGRRCAHFRDGWRLASRLVLVGVAGGLILIFSYGPVHPYAVPQWLAVSVVLAFPRLLLVSWTAAARQTWRRADDVIHRKAMRPQRVFQLQLWRLLAGSLRLLFWMLHGTLAVLATLLARLLRMRRELRGFRCREPSCTYFEEDPLVRPPRALPDRLTQSLGTWPKLAAPLAMNLDAASALPPGIGSGQPVQAARVLVPTWIGLIQLESRGFRRDTPPGCVGTCPVQKAHRTWRIMVMAANGRSNALGIADVLEAFRGTCTPDPLSAQRIEDILAAVARGEPVLRRDVPVIDEFQGMFRLAGSQVNVTLELEVFAGDRTRFAPDHLHGLVIAAPPDGTPNDEQSHFLEWALTRPLLHTVPLPAVDQPKMRSGPPGLLRRVFMPPGPRALQLPRLPQEFVLVVGPAGLIVGPLHLQLQCVAYGNSSIERIKEWLQ